MSASYSLPSALPPPPRLGTGAAVGRVASLLSVLILLTRPRPEPAAAVGRCNVAAGDDCARLLPVALAAASPPAPVLLRLVRRVTRAAVARSSTLLLPLPPSSPSL